MLEGVQDYWDCLGLEHSIDHLGNPHGKACDDRNQNYLNCIIWCLVKSVKIFISQPLVEKGILQGLSHQSWPNTQILL